MQSTRTARLAAFVVLLGGRAAIGDVIRVPEDYPTIQEGIDAAVDGDEVVIADGTWTGPGNSNLDFGGRVITVRSENGAGACTLDGENVVGIRAFEFKNDEPPEARIVGLTMQRFVVVGDGAAIYAPLSEPTIEDCVFLGNRAIGGAGGALYVTSSLIQGCSFLANSADLAGALFGLEFVVRDCSFVQNSAEFAGAMLTTCGGVLDRCSFSGNLAVGNAARAGAIYVAGCVSIDHCTFEDNMATTVDGGTRAGGGAIFSGDSGPINVRNSVFRRNRAIVEGAGPQTEAVGGAIDAVVNVDVDLRGCLFANNMAIAAGAAAGGAVFVQLGVDFDATNCTFNNNDVQAKEESGRAIWLSVYEERDPSIRNSIIWDTGAGPPSITVGHGSPLPTVEYCDIRGGGWAGPGNIRANPRFVDAFGGNLHLMPGSPCIDAASNDAVPPGQTEDLDGRPRRADDPDTKDTGQGDPPVVDMGAYEFQPLECPEDLDGSGDVGFDDLLILLNAWGECNDCPEDLDGSGDVGFDDLLILLAAWGPC